MSYTVQDLTGTNTYGPTSGFPLAICTALVEGEDVVVLVSSGDAVNPDLPDRTVCLTLKTGRVGPDGTNALVGLITPKEAMALALLLHREAMRAIKNSEGGQMPEGRA